MKYLWTFLFIFTTQLALYPASNTFAQEKEYFIIQKINDHVYILKGGSLNGANVGVVIGDDAILLVDSNLHKNQQALLNTLRKLSDKPVKYVVNTHHHSDHTGNNNYFAQHGATIIAHKNEKLSYLTTSSQLTFEDKITLKINGEEVRSFHVISHSFDDAIIQLYDSNVIFTGDNYATTWGPGLGYNGLKGQKSALNMILALSNDDTIVVPGHGVASTKKDILDYKSNSITWTQRVMNLYQQGKNINQIGLDKDIIALKIKFDGGDKNNFDPAGIKYWINETIWGEKLTTPSWTKNQLKLYTGIYLLEDNNRIEIFEQVGRLFAREIFQPECTAPAPKLGDILIVLTPHSKNRLNFMNWGAGEHFLFNIDKTGTLESTYLVLEDKRYLAKKIKNLIPQ